MKQWRYPTGAIPWRHAASVLLEAMACGTPVVATKVWGTPEVVAAPETGVLMDERSADGIVRAIARLRQASPARSATRAYAAQFGWQPTTDEQLALFRRVLKVGGG